MIRISATSFVVPFALATSLLTASNVHAAGDAAAGQAYFSSHCAACHSTSAGVNKIGPSLAGIVGSKAGSVPGFNFSAGIKNANVTWNDDSLDKFLQNPNGFVHGTKMFYSVPNPTYRQNVIAYLNTLKR
jgi:cytochrome c